MVSQFGSRVHLVVIQFSRNLSQLGERKLLPSRFFDTAGLFK